MTTVAPATVPEFDAETHTYRVDGRIVPSVTTALGSLTHYLYSRIPADVLEPAIARGNAVHKATELDDYGILDWSRLDPAAWPYVEAWQRFKSESGIEILQIEQRVYHPTLRFAGTFDRLARMPDGKLAVVEIKTAQKHEGWWAWQLAGYQLAYNHNVAAPIRRRLSVQLKPDGAINVTEYPDHEGDRNVFLAYLAVHNAEASAGYGRMRDYQPDYGAI